jgi:hypothetical protein
LADDVVTLPAVLVLGAGQWSTARQPAATAVTAGPSIFAKPSPTPPVYGML